MCEYVKVFKDWLSLLCGKVVGMFVFHTNLTEARADWCRLVCYDCGVACDLTKMREERLDFLGELRAETPPAPREAREDEAPAPKRRQPAVARPQGAPSRVRLGFRKIGRAAYRGHLDLVRVLPRVFRRAGMPLYYSQGFHPKPEMVFSPALALGIASLAEYVDVKLDGDVPFVVDGLVARLNAVTEPGVEFTSARALDAQDRRLTRAIDEAVYVAGVPRAALVARGITDLAALVEARKRVPLAALRETKEPGLKKRVDLSQFLLDVTAGEGADALDAAGIAGDLVPLRVRLRITGSGAARPAEVLSALLGTDEEIPAQWVRTALYAHVGGERVAPREVERLRRAPAATEPAGAAAT